MSIEGKHAYRFGFLKSEKWKIVRLEALAREKGCCQICGKESISNDAHHIWYPKSIYETEERHLVVLCRSCHDFIHSMMPECKTNDEFEGRTAWMKFYNAIKIWRCEHGNLFDLSDFVENDVKVCAPELRQELKRLRKKLDDFHENNETVSKDFLLEQIGLVSKTAQQLVDSIKQFKERLSK